MEFLDKVAQPEDWNQISLKQKTNVVAQAGAFDELCRGMESPPQVAIIDCARDFLLKVDSDICVGSAHTLRTNNDRLWILPAPGLRKTFGELGRLLNRNEKCRISGILPESLDSLNPAQLEISVGNTIPVPLIGAILVPVLRAWLIAKDLESVSSDSSSNI